MFLIHFSVALAQNTTGITTTTTMAAAGRNGSLTPHMRPCAPCQRFEWMDDNPLSLQMYFLGGWGCVWPSKHSFVLAMMNRHNIGVFWGLYTPPTAPKIYLLAWGLPPIHLTCWCRAQGLMWGTRGPFLLAAAMVGYGCAGRCWPLEAYVRSTYCRISKNCWKK